MYTAFIFQAVESVSFKTLRSESAATGVRAGLIISNLKKKTNKKKTLTPTNPGSL